MKYHWRGALFIMAGIAANLSVFGAMFFTPEQTMKLFPFSRRRQAELGIRISQKDGRVEEVLKSAEEIKAEEAKVSISRDSSTLPLKYDSSRISSIDSSEDINENLPIKEYVYLWADRRFLLLAAR